MFEARDVDWGSSDRPAADGKWTRRSLALLCEKRDILFLSLIAYLPISRAVLFVRNKTNRSLEAYAAVDMQNSINIVATLLMMAMLLRPRARLSNVRILQGPTQWLVIYYVFCILSCTWGASPVYVAYRAVELLALFFFMGLILDKITDPRDGIVYLCRFSAATAILPYLSQVMRSGGLFQHTNAYSASGAFGAVLALAAIKRGVVRFADVKYSLIACLAAVVFGTSSASNVSLVIGLLIIAAASKRYAVSMGRLVVISLVVFVVLMHGFEIVRPYVFPGKNIENITSLRGRTYVFSNFWDAFQEHPILGYGFASGERSIDLGGRGITNSTHNSVLSVAVNTGIIGLLLFGMGFYFILRALYQADLMGDCFAFPILVALVVALINSMSYPLVGSSWKYVTTPFFGIVAYVSIFLTPACYVSSEEYSLRC